MPSALSAVTCGAWSVLGCLLLRAETTQPRRLDQGASFNATLVNDGTIDELSVRVNNALVHR